MIGKPITTVEELCELINNHKCVLVNYATPYRIPATSMLSRTFKNVLDLLNGGLMYEYIKEPKKELNWFIKQKSK